MTGIVRSALFACAAFVSVAHAQALAPRTVTLEQALAAAQKSNPGLIAVRQQVEEAARRDRVVASN